MIALDSSVLVAAFATWHLAHRAAVATLRRSPRLLAHSAMETFSVLTRLAPPHRAQPAMVAAFFLENFVEPPLTLSPEGHAGLLQEVPAKGIVGGAIYDALIAATAREAGAMLVSRDLRAAATYDRIGARFELLV